MECDPEAQDAPQRGEELADEICTGTVIRNPHLTRILYNYISGAVYFLYKFRGNLFVKIQIELLKNLTLQ
jgi:hypothetical protein